VIWLTWRRHRLTLTLTIGALIVLGVWMLFVAHRWTLFIDDNENLYRICGNNFGCRNRLASKQGFVSLGGTFSITRQATAIDLILLTVPCVLGVVFGVPLVSGEFAHSTNRLLWTQGISRSKWLAVSWLLVALPLVILISLYSVFEWWWSYHAYFGSVFTHYGFEGRVSPPVFGATGLVPVAYTLFALALGTAMGAILRRIPLAVIGTVVLYAAVALLMVTTIRPVLAPRVFVPITNLDYGFGTDFLIPWKLGPAYRFVPGSDVRGGASATEIGVTCLSKDPNEDGLVSEHVLDPPFARCLASQHIQFGTVYMPYRSFWLLQWRESAIYLILSGGLFGLSIWSVRRWQA
jgi:hypothetical protein